MVIINMPLTSYYLTLRNSFVKIIWCLIKKKEIKLRFKMPLVYSEIILKAYLKGCQTWDVLPFMYLFHN